MTTSKELKQVLAASGGGLEIDDAKFSGIAYAGDKIAQYWSDAPVVIDLAGLTLAPQIPLLYNHCNDPEYRLGVLTAINDGSKLSVTGTIDGSSQLGAGIIRQGRKFDWQLSIGTGIVDEMDVLCDKETATVNGRDFSGPLCIVRRATLREVSVVAVGADEETHLRIAAGFLNNRKSETKGGKMEKDLTPTISAKAETTPAAAPAVDVDAIVSARLEAADKAEKARIEAITANFGSDHPELLAKAIAGKMSVEEANKALIAALRADRPVNVICHNNQTEAGEFGKCVEAAALMSAGIDGNRLVKEYGDKVVSAAAKEYRSGMGLQRIILEAAWRADETDRFLGAGNWAKLVRAAWSAVDLPGILGNVANKMLLEGYGSVDNAWRRIASTASVKDFRPMNRYRLGSDFRFDRVQKGGEITHGSLDEDAFSNQAKTYGALLKISREDIINDDLNALSKVPQEMGRCAALAFNEIFWQEFLDDSDFFKSANGNKLTGNALSISGLAAAVKAFRTLKDKHNKLIGGLPSILLVPASLAVTAESLYKDVTVVAAGSTDKVIPNGNPHAGKYAPVDTPYLDETTGGSTTAYYLLGDPRYRAAINAVFLNGVEVPTIESGDVAFDQLGIQMRAYMDFGVAKEDPKAGIKVTGTN